jgi:flagellar basal-body rod protein FlgF
MDRMLYIAMTGAKESLLAQAVTTHNLANVSTTGFRADLAAFQSRPVYGPGYPSRAYSVTEGSGVDLSPGTLVPTERELDVAINGDGWIAVQAPDGSEGYTRAGDLRVDTFGRLTNGAGHPVLGNGGPIALPPFEKLEIGADGTLSIQPVGQAPNTLAVVDRIKLVRPDDPASLVKGRDGLLHTPDAGAAPPDARVRLVSGMLESSNANAVEAMVSLIEQARNFETQVKMMHAAEDNDRAAAELMRMG